MNVVYRDRNELCIIEETEYNELIVSWALSHGYDRIYLTKSDILSGILITTSFFRVKTPVILREYKQIELEEYSNQESEKWFAETKQTFIPILNNGSIKGEIQKQETSRALADLYWNLIDVGVNKKNLANIKRKVVFTMPIKKAEALADILRKEKIQLYEITEAKQASAFEEEDITVIYCDRWQRKAVTYMGEKEFITLEHIYCQLMLETLLDFYQKNHISYYYVKVDSKRKLPKYIVDRMYKGTFLEFAKDQNAINDYYKDDERNILFWTSGDYRKFSVIKKDIGIYLKDCVNKTYNVIDGKRYTPGNPQEYEYTVHCHGSCIVRGAGVSDESTISSYLQQEYNKEGSANIRVLNYGTVGAEGIYYINNLFMDCYRNNDIVLHFDVDDGISRIIQSYCNDYPIQYVEIKNAFNEQNSNQPLFIDIETIAHCNHKANEIMAKYLYNMIKADAKEEDASWVEINIRGNPCVEQSQEVNALLEEYKERLLTYRKDNYKKTVNGAIVMNCNPFTLGHLYLIEESRKKVDCLYIFVVQEDKSYFSFEDRYEMVKLNCKSFENVIVIPSGKLILSALTFPEYFFKEEQKEAIINPSQDIALFGKEIAPLLNIRYRFVGEEPTDLVTAQYNRFLAEKLPLFDITLIEIPRKSVNNTVISASRVRALLKENKLEESKKYLPDPTYQFLCKKYQ